MIIIKYSNQHTKIRNIIQKYWHLLSMDPNVGRFISQTPSINFRCATSIKDHITQSEFKEEGRGDPCRLKGTYTCGGYNFCRYIWVGSSCRLPNGQTFRARHFANCKTQGVVYLMLCDCGSFMWARQRLNSVPEYPNMFGVLRDVTPIYH